MVDSKKLKRKKINHIRPGRPCSTKEKEIGGTKSIMEIEEILYYILYCTIQDRDNLKVCCDKVH